MRCRKWSCIGGRWRCRIRPNCPPESGGQHDRDSSRDRARGGSRAVLSMKAFWNISLGEPPLASSQRTRWRTPICLHSPLSSSSAGNLFGQH